ncbi:MAG: hypothetical protein SPI25_07625 [Dialister sp.]|nr:hypothetical protein [Dialister sp.]
MPDTSDMTELSLFDMASSAPAPGHKKEGPAKKEAEPILKTKAASPHLPSFSPETAWSEKFWEFDITHPSAAIKAAIKEALLTEGFSKREANRLFKGLFFKEKIFNTKKQAEEYLKALPHTYAVKYKIGIQPSPQMVRLKKRLAEKQDRLRRLQAEQQEKKFSGPFLTCPVCKSRVNAAYIKPPTCPVCAGDMRSPAAVKVMGTLEKTITELSKRYEDTSRKYNSRFTGGEKWIIRLVNSLKNGGIK